MPLRLLVALATFAPLIAAADALPTVASINLCSDQLVLRVADPAQILSVSWLASDPEESMLAALARRYPRNYGSAEEILRVAPDVVVAGVFTNGFTRRLLADLGYRVVEVVPAESVDEIERNLRAVGAAIGRGERAEQVVARMRAHSAALEARQSAAPSAVVIRPGGFTVGAGSLADDLLRLAGVRNVAAVEGLDRWGSLSIETLLRTSPDLLVHAGYRREEPSLANAVLEHPALARLAREAASVTIPAKYWSCGLPESLRSVEILQAAARRARLP